MPNDNSKAAEDIFPPKKNGFEKFADAVTGFCGASGPVGPEGEKAAEAAQVSMMDRAVTEIRRIACQLAAGEPIIGGPTLDHTRLAVEVWKQVRSEQPAQQRLQDVLQAGTRNTEIRAQNAIPPIRGARTGRVPMGGRFEDEADGRAVKMPDHIRQLFAKLPRGERSQLLNDLNTDFVEQDSTHRAECPGPIEVRSGDRIPPNRG